jgi:hypothetical protein
VTRCPQVPHLRQWPLRISFPQRMHVSVESIQVMLALFGRKGREASECNQVLKELCQIARADIGYVSLVSVISLSIPSPFYPVHSALYAGRSGGGRGA